VNTTTSNRIFAAYRDGGRVDFRIEPAITDDNGILLECVVNGPNGTLVSEGSIILVVLERLSTYVCMLAIAGST
jgi:hypothetical protein